MYHPTVKGGYYEMGSTYGAILYKNGFRIPPQPPEQLEFGKKSSPEVKRVFPQVLEEMEGFADACHASHEEMAAFMLGVGCFKVTPMCSVFAARNGGDVTVGRNYDFFYTFKKYTESYLTCPEDGYMSIGHTDIFIGREDGVNEEGLAVAMTGVAEKVIKPGINFPLVIRYILDRCATVEEGVNVLSTAHLSTTSNYLLADRKGDMAVVEASPEKVRVRRSSTFIVTTNHFVHPDMQDAEERGERETSNWDTLPRYEMIATLLEDAQGRTDVEKARAILANHKGYVCSHQKKVSLGTLWSLVLTLRTPDVYRAEGHPCRAAFKRDLRMEKALRAKNVGSPG